VDEEDLEPRRKAPKLRDLAPLAVAELETYITELESEIVRVRNEIAAKRKQGLYTNLFFDGGNPVIYYFNRSTDSLMAARNGGGKVWDFETVATGGGRHNHVALDADGFETAVWLDDASGDLEVADL